MTFWPDTLKQSDEDTDHSAAEARENELTDVLDGADAAFDKVQGDFDRQPSKPSDGAV